MVLVSHTPKLQEEAFRTVVEAVRSGRIAENASTSPRTHRPGEGEICEMALPEGRLLRTSIAA